MLRPQRLNHKVENKRINNPHSDQDQRGGGRFVDKHIFRDRHEDEHKILDSKDKRVRLDKKVLLKAISPFQKMMCVQIKFKESAISHRSISCRGRLDLDYMCYC